MFPNLQIPFALPDLRPGAEMLLGTLDRARQRDTADHQAAVQEMYAKNAEAKLSAALERDKHRFEAERKAEMDKVIDAANTLEMAGDKVGAEGLRSRHGIKSTPIMSPSTTLASTVVTPTQALGSQAQPQSQQSTGAYRSPSTSPTQMMGQHTPRVVTPAQAFGPAGYPMQSTPGNIDLQTRPRVTNPDGTVSTVRSMSTNIDGREVLMPTVSEDGRIMSDDEAVAQYRQTGRHLGQFGTVDEANAYAEQLHRDQEAGIDTRTGERFEGAGAENTMPLTIPGDVIPGEPTGASRLTGPGGEDLGTIDPEAQRRFREQKAERVSAALGPLGKRYQLVEQLVASGDLDPKQASTILQALSKEDAAGAKVADREDKQQFNREENEKYRDTPAMRDRRAFTVARIKAAADKLRAEGKDRDADRMEINSLRGEVKAWKKDTVNLPIDNKQGKDLHAASVLLNSNNPVSQADGFEAMLRIFRGGVATMGAQQLIQKHLSGVKGSIEGWLENKVTGGYGDEERTNLRDAVKLALTENKERKRLAMDSFDEKFTGSPTWQNLGQTVAEERNAIMAEWGEEPTMKSGEEGPVIGPRGKGVKPRKPEGRLSDAEAIKIARERYRRNPNDEPAKLVLKKHGILKD